jgi:hypothetical protein
MKRGIAIESFFVAASLAACSSGSSGSSGPNVDSSKRVAMLSTDEQKTVCDWIAQQWGGYGHSVTCDAGGGFSVMISAPWTNQTGCLAQFAQVPAGCPATVGQASACYQQGAQTACAPMQSSTCITLQQQCSPTSVDAGSD